MSPIIFSIILWLPFVLVILISGAIFCISGYKKGIWRALISLGVTLVSAIISFLLSKLIAGLIAGGFIDMVIAMIPQDGAIASLISSLVGNLVQAFVAIILFSILFFVLTIVLKIVANVVKKEELLVEDKNLKWAGLGVRAFDAILYTTLLLLPLYGSLGAYMPIVQTVTEMKESGSSEYVAYFDAITGHPLISISSKGPISFVYNELSKVKSDGSTISLPRIVGNLQDTMAKYNALSTLEGEEYEMACVELISHIKDNILEEDWSYDLIQQTTGVLKEQVLSGMEGADETSKQMVETAVGILDMPKEEFQENGVIILDYMEYALANNVMKSFQTKDMSELKNEEFYTETATFLNATSQTVELKKYFLNQAVSQAVGGDEEAVKKIMDSYDATSVSTPAAQQKEIETLITVAGSTTREEIREALKSSPSFDSSVIDEVFNGLNAE